MSNGTDFSCWCWSRSGSELLAYILILIHNISVKVKYVPVLYSM